MHRLKFIALTLLPLLLAACGPKSSGPEVAVAAYLQALVGKKGDQLTALSCANWEQQAALELDSFQAVKASLKDLSCKQTGTDGNQTLVQCQGKIVATYNTENQELDLSARTYAVVQEGGEWRVCGYR
ncbi:MAG TPA: hypothetical protein VMT46_16775 [Anaerolineaceae bacterium]|nr:hypothetical protein [Anaerolineaceae bacterium]